MTSIKKKLELKKETIQVLENARMRQANGGNNPFTGPVNTSGTCGIETQVNCGVDWWKSRVCATLNKPNDCAGSESCIFTVCIPF